MSEQENKDDPNLVKKEELKKTAEAIEDNWSEYFKTLDQARLNLMKEKMENDTYHVDIDGKDTVFKRRKIRAKEYMALEKLRGQFREAKDRIDAAEVLFNVYQKAAEYYMVDAETEKPMTKEQFEASEWEEMKLLVDGFNFITLYGIPKH